MGTSALRAKKKELIDDLNRGLDKGQLAFAVIHTIYFARHSFLRGMEDPTYTTKEFIGKVRGKDSAARNFNGGIVLFEKDNFISLNGWTDFFMFEKVRYGIEGFVIGNDNVEKVSLVKFEDMEDFKRKRLQSSVKYMGRTPGCSSFENDIKAMDIFLGKEQVLYDLLVTRKSKLSDNKIFKKFVDRDKATKEEAHRGILDLFELSKTENDMKIIGERLEEAKREKFERVVRKIHIADGVTMDVRKFLRGLEARVEQSKSAPTKAHA